jgi:hypothetical protein
MHSSASPWSPSRFSSTPRRTAGCPRTARLGQPIQARLPLRFYANEAQAGLRRKLCQRNGRIRRPAGTGGPRRQKTSTLADVDSDVEHDTSSTVTSSVVSAGSDFVGVDGGIVASALGVQATGAGEPRLQKKGKSAKKKKKRKTDKQSLHLTRRQRSAGRSPALALIAQGPAQAALIAGRRRCQPWWRPPSRG